MSRFSKTETGIEGLYVLEPRVFPDERGYFFEAYNQRDFSDIGLCMHFVQDNESFSVKNVLRGLHVQKNYPQGKLVRAAQGSIYDVAVDLRKGSCSFGTWYGVELSEENKRQFYIPEGFAHGFLVISEFARVVYKVTDFWHPDDETGIPWNDPDLNISWPLPEGASPLIADKDQSYPPFRETVMKEGFR